MRYISVCGSFISCVYCTCVLAYITLRFLITLFIVTIARYVENTTKQGTKKIVEYKKSLIVLSMLLLMRPR